MEKIWNQILWWHKNHQQLDIGLSLNPATKQSVQKTSDKIITYWIFVLICKFVVIWGGCCFLGGTLQIHWKLCETIEPQKPTKLLHAILVDEGPLYLWLVNLALPNIQGLIEGFEPLDFP